MTFDEVFTYENLYNAYRKCLNGVRWKGTVQHYEQFSLTELNKTLEELRNGTFKSGKFFRFTIMERGKVRHIKSVGIAERVVQRCFCDNYLVPTLSKEFIYDNSACIKGKGYHFALNRCRYHLRKYYRKHHTNEGYILQFDFHHYFDTIPHQQLIDLVTKFTTDERINNLYAQLVNDFDGDKGLGLGSQISQISALFYPNKIDHYFKSVKGIDAYARYMDDGYLISSDKTLLQRMKKELTRLVSELGLTLNENKTQIRKLKCGFIFLKGRFFFTETGKVIVKPNRKGITRNRRKAKKLIKKGFPLEAVKKFVDIVVGNLKHYNAYYTIKNFKEEIAMAIKQQHPYIDEHGVAHEDLIKTYSDEGHKIIQLPTYCLFDEAIDRYPCRFTYIEDKPEEPKEEVGGDA